VLHDAGLIAMIVIVVALLIGAAIMVKELPCDPKVQHCLSQPEKP
jgi:hypothetical protein